MKAPFYDWQWAPLQNFSSHLYHAVNLQLCLPSLALFSQLELMEPSPSFSEGIAFDSVDHPHSKEASHYLFFSWPEQKRIYACKVPWNKMTELLWWRVKIQPVIELPRRSTNLQWTCQPQMQPVFVCHCQLACKRSTDLSDEDYDAAPWRLIAATRTMHILYNVLPMQSSFDANCWAVERCGMIVAMHRSSEMIQEEKPEYKPNTCRFLTILPSNFLFSGAWFDPRRLQESQSNDCDCYASRHLFMNPNKSSSLLGQGFPMTLEDNPNWNTNQDNLGTWQWWRFVKSTHTW